MQSIYSYKSYKKYIQDLIESLGRGAVGKLAEAADCNRTYLSQCLSSKIQLTADHVMGIGEYAALTEEEQDFFLLLLLRERSASKKNQEKIRIKMEKIIQDNLILSKKISDKKDSSEISEIQKTKYYSSWKYAACHTLTSIKEFQTLTSLAKKMKISEIETQNILKDLIEMSLITTTGLKYFHSGKNIHIPIGSAHVALNHLNWRLKSTEDVNSKVSVHYTTVFALDKKDWDSLRKQLVDFIENQRDQIHRSGSEEIYCFSCDLFQPLE